MGKRMKEGAVQIAKAEYVLSKTEEQLRAVLEQAPLAIAITGAQGDIQFSNTMFDVLWGRSAHDTVASKYSQVYAGFHLDGTPIESEEWPGAKALMQGEVVIDQVLEIVHQSGRKIPCSFNAGPIRNEEGKITGAVVLFRDVTAERTARMQLQESEEKYHCLFNSIDAGFCILQVLFNENEIPYDYRFLEANNAFEKQTGLIDAVGKTMKEIVHGHEQYWFDIFGRIAKTGKSERFENEAKALGIYYDVFAFSVGEPEEKRVGVLFKDITERKQIEEKIRVSEKQQAFLLKISDALRPLDNPVDIEETATKIALDFMDTDWCHYVSIEEDNLIIQRGASRDDFPSLAGEYSISSFALLKAVLNIGIPLIIDDVHTTDILDEDLKQLCIQYQNIAIVIVPVIKNGKHVGLFVLVQSKPRKWTESEVQLTIETAERIWAAVERAKAEEALRKSEEQISLDLADTKKLQAFSTQLIREENIDLLYKQLVDAAIALMKSDMASIQLYHPEKEQLELLSYKGFHPESAGHWKWINTDSKSICSAAMKNGDRCIVSDLEKEERTIETGNLHYYQLSGIKAVQSTPLISRNGNLVGMISTHWRDPHQPSERELQLFDVLARQAADLIERKKTEEKIKESEHRYHALFMHSPFAFSIMNGKDMKVTFANDLMLEFWGKGKNVEGKSLLEILPELSNQPFPAMIDSVYKTGVPVHANEMLAQLNHNGILEDRYFDIVYEPHFEADNTISGVITIAHDVTQQVVSRKNIEESETLFKLALSLTAQTVFKQDTQLRYTWIYNIHPSFEMKDFVGKTDFDLFSNDAAEILTTIKQTVLNTGITFNGDIQIEIDGKPSDFALMVEVTKDVAGKITGIIAVTDDITEKKQAENKIKASEEKFKRLVLQAPVAICVLRGEDYVIETMNEGMCVFWDRTLAQALNKPVFDVLPEVKDQGIKELLDNVYFTGERCVLQELSVNIRRNDKLENAFVKLVYEPLREADGTISGVMALAHEITEQVMARKKVEESEKRFEAAILAVEGIIWTSNAQGEMIGKQPGWAKLTGQHFEEYQGYGWAKAIHPDDAQPTLSAWTDAVNNQKTFEFEHRVKTKQNDWRLFSVKAVPAFDKTGAMQQWIGVHTDITEQKLAEQKLTYRTALLEAHNQASIDGILLVDAKGKIISFNQCFIEIWNMPQHIVDAKDDEAALSFAMTQLVNPQLFIDKVKYHYEHPTEMCLDELDFKDGKIVERNGYPVIGDDGTHYAWSWTFRDITEQKNYEKIIIESEQRFRTLAETLPQLIWMTNEKGAYEYASSHWINYSGLDPYAGDTWEKLVHPHDLESLAQGWESSLKTGKTFNSEARLKNKNGMYSWHLVQGEPIKSEQGTIIKWIGAFTDIENLKEEQKQKNDFLSMASHELRTPVTTIKGYGQIIERLLAEKNDLKTLGFVKKMTKQVNRLDTLITDLLDITKMQRGGLIRNESVFNFNDLVKEVVDDMQKTTVTHQIIDNLNADLEIKGDKDKLSQVLNNLISNATKYSPAADKIIVSTQIVKDGVQLSVQDFGIGISIEGQQRVFEQFYRVDGENQSTFQGMGIGLYICAEIIKKEGGNIWVESTGGEGSVFYVWLPVDHNDGTEGQ